MSMSALPTFGLVRNFLLCPLKAKYGRALLPPAHEACFRRAVNALTRKEPCWPRHFFQARLLYPLANTWALEGISFQHDFQKGSKLLKHAQLILQSCCKKGGTDLKVSRSGALYLYSNITFLKNQREHILCFEFLAFF